MKFCLLISCGRGSVRLWRRCDMLCTSCFMDDVTFGRSGPYGDTGAESDVDECRVVLLKEIVFQSKAWTNCEYVYLVTLAYSAFCSCDLDLDPVTSIYESYLDILKMYLRDKNEVSRSRLSKVRAQTRQTDTDTQTKATKRIITRIRWR